LLQRYGGEYARLIKRKRSGAANQEADRAHTVKRVLLDVATGLGPLKEARRVSKHGVASAERVAAAETMRGCMFEACQTARLLDSQRGDRSLAIAEKCGERAPCLVTACWGVPSL